MRMNKLSSIKNSLILFSATIIILMAVLSIYSLGIMNRYKNQISSMFENHIYLESLKEQMDDLDRNLLDYLTSKSSTKLNNYLIGMEDVTRLFDEFYQLEIQYDELMMKNVQNLAEQYMLETDLAITYKRQRNVEEYYKHYNKGKKIQEFIFEYIDIMNQEQISINSVTYNELIEQTKLLQTITIIIIVDLILFSILIVYMVISKMVKPINQLHKTAEAISLGDFSIEDVVITSDDEFKLLANAFNNMKNSIVNYIEALKLKAETEAELKDEQMKNLKMAYLLDNAKLSALQSQIDPHFLFNTINAGVQLSVIENASKTGEFLETMSRLFRYSLRMKTNDCTVYDELNNIRDYYDLLKVRFGQRIKFEFDIDEVTLTTHMPPMVLQPIVENSYIHGLSSLESGGTISITSRKENNKIIITIHDNGVGISDEKLDQIFNTSNNESIGVRNVKERLELFYHQEGLFRMESDNGVKTTIILPVKEL